MAYTLEQYYDTGPNNYSSITSTSWRGQTFTTGDGFSISKVSVLSYRIGTPGTITISIRATSGGLPTGGDLVSATFDGNTITEDVNGLWYDAVFTTPYSLASNTQYALLVRSSAGAPSYLRWRFDSSSSTYSGGLRLFSTDSGTTFTADSGSDTMFRTYSGSDTAVVEASISGGFTGGGSLSLGVATSESLSIAGGFTGGGSVFLLGSSAWAGNYDTKQYVVAFGNNQVWYCEV